MCLSESLFLAEQWYPNLSAFINSIGFQTFLLRRLTVELALGVGKEILFKTKEELS